MSSKSCLEYIKEGLEYIIKEGPTDPHQGICANLDDYLNSELPPNHEKYDTNYAYDFVFFNCVGWNSIEEPDEWPINRVLHSESFHKSTSKWTDEALNLRHSLMSYLIKRIDDNNVDDSVRD